MSGIKKVKFHPKTLEPKETKKCFICKYRNIKSKTCRKMTVCEICQKTICKVCLAIDSDSICFECIDDDISSGSLEFNSEI